MWQAASGKGKALRMTIRKIACGGVILLGIALLALGCTRSRPETTAPIATTTPMSTLPYCTPVPTSQPTFVPGAGPTVISAEASPTVALSPLATVTPPLVTAAPEATCTVTPEATATTAPSAPAEGTDYIVQPNDTLYSIALRCGTTVGDLVALNGLSSPDQIQAGQVLKIRGAAGPVGSGQYVVRAGDTMFSVAQRFGVTVEALGQMNGISSPWVIRTGQVLAIPSGASGAGAGAVQGNAYTVQAGDTLFSIATRYGVTVDAIAAANGLANPEQIAVGQILIIP